MDKVLRSKIQDKLKKTANTSRVKLPKGFLFSEENDTLIMTFCAKQGFGWDRKACNMQNDSAAFEGWALVLYVHYLGGKGKICLDIRSEDMPQASEALYTEYHHYSRFLYRVLRFTQYPWFQPSGRLKALVDDFDGFLKRYTFVNNMPSDSVGEKGNLESIVESRFVENAFLREKLNAAEIYRQLPVGLFRETAATKNRVFTGRSSAIDLWTISDDSLTVIELKAGNNKKAGALTELFFYANYAYDMFVKQGNSFQPNTACDHRGFDLLRARYQSGFLKKVRGYLLLDEESRHPLITDAVLKELSQGAITYDCLMYQMDTDVGIRLQ